MAAVFRDLGVTPIPKRRLFSSLVAVLLTLALGPTLVELHSTAQEHSPLDRPVEIFTGATHPAQPAHFEASASVEREACTYCILQLQAAGRLQAPPALATRISTPQALAMPEWYLPAIASFVPSSPRAPPAELPA